MGKGLKIASLALVALLALGGVTMALMPPADLRPEGLRGPVDAAAEKKGRALLARLPEAYGGLERWRAARVTRVWLSDFWPDGIAKTVAYPWRDGESMELTYQNGQDNARAVFEGSDRAGHAWGIQNWVTYSQAPGGERVFAPDDEIKFWLPTIQYFAELPFRMLEAGVVQYAGERQLGGETYDLIYATWNDAEPQERIDQYLVWINRQSGRADWVQYTVRDMHKSALGCMHYEDYRQVDGLTFPFRMTAGGTPEAPETMHRMDVTRVELLPEHPLSELVPEPERKARK